MKTLLLERNKLIQRIVKQEVHEFVEYYFTGKVHRRACATCGRMYTPIMRYHFFCTSECRTEWYRGMFKPRD